MTLVLLLYIHVYIHLVYTYTLHIVVLHTENEARGGGNMRLLRTWEGGGGATMLPYVVSTYWHTKGLCVTFWETLVYFSVTVEISGHVFPD